MINWKTATPEEIRAAANANPMIMFTPEGLAWVRANRTLVEKWSAEDMAEARSRPLPSLDGFKISAELKNEFKRAKPFGR